MFSYMCLTSIVICVFLILTSFMIYYDQLRHLNYQSLVRNREKLYFGKEAITCVLGSNFEMHFMVI